MNQYTHVRDGPWHRAFALICRLAGMLTILLTMWLPGVRDNHAAGMVNRVSSGYFQVPANNTHEDFRVSLPLKALRVTSPFGWRFHPITGKPDYHTGVDLAASSDSVFAILEGKIEITGYHPSLGNYIRMRHGEFESIYGHLSRIMVLPGDSLASGRIIGITGATGSVTGEHLHFSIRFRGRYIHPLLFLNKLIEHSSQLSNP